MFSDLQIPTDASICSYPLIRMLSVNQDYVYSNINPHPLYKNAGYYVSNKYYSLKSSSRLPALLSACGA